MSIFARTDECSDKVIMYTLLHHSFAHQYTLYESKLVANLLTA